MVFFKLEIDIISAEKACCNRRMYSNNDAFIRKSGWGCGIL